MTLTIRDLKNALYKDKKTFDVALLANNDENIVNNYILNVCNTVALSPELLKCTAESIRDAAITSATLQIPIDSRGYAYLIPYSGKAQFQLSYKGHISIAKRDKDIDNIYSVIVYKDDDFSVDIGENTIKHIPDLESDSYGNEKDLRFVYAVVKFKPDTGRSMMFEIMTKKQIDEIRSISKNIKNWDKWYGEYSRKTVLKRLTKHAQLGDSRVDAIEYAFEQGKIVNVTPGGVVEAEDLLEKDKIEILSAISDSSTEEELKKVFANFSEKLEEIACYNVTFSKEIRQAYVDKDNEIYMERITDSLNGCEDVDSIDKVYSAHKVRIERLRAKERNEIETIYVTQKERLLNAAYR